MKQYIKKTGVLLAALFMLVGFTSCGERVQVPEATVGYVKGPNGITDEVASSTTYRLPFWGKWGMILVETSHFVQKEPLRVMMPKDKLNFEFEVRGTYAIPKSKARFIVENVRSQRNRNNGSHSVFEINEQKVYETYVQQIIRTKCRSIIADYSITEVMTNLDAISQRLHKEIESELENAPIKVIRLGIADAQPPKIIVDAEEARVKREVEIRQADADKLVQLKQAETRLEVERKNQEIDLLEAETQVLVEKKLAESVSEAFVTQRGLKILDTMAKSPNKVIILPTEAFSNPEIMMGIHQQTHKDVHVSR